MDPGGVLGKFLDEPGAGAGAAAFAAAGVANVGDVALDHFAIFVVDGHGPHFFAGGLGAVEKLVEIIAGRAECADVHVGEGDADGAGQGGGVDQVGGAEFAGVEHAVGENHAAFGIGIDDFDGLAGHGDLHVAGLLGAATGHIFGGGNYGDDRDRGFQVSDGTHGAEHGGAAAHVVLHQFHTIGGLDGNAAGIKGDGLADQAEHRGIRTQVGGRVAQDDHARGLDATLGHADQSAHFQFGNFAFVQNFDAQANFLSHGFGLGCQHARGEAVGRFVDQIAGEILRFGDDAAVVDGFLQILRAIETSKQDALYLLVFFLFGVVFVRFEVGNRQAFDDGLDGGRAAFPFAGEEDEFLHAARFQITQGGSGNFAQIAGGELVDFSGADDQQALRVHAFGKMDQHGLQRLAGDFSAGD